MKRAKTVDVRRLSNSPASKRWTDSVARRRVQHPRAGADDADDDNDSDTRPRRSGDRRLGSRVGWLAGTERVDGPRAALSPPLALESPGRPPAGRGKPRSRAPPKADPSRSPDDSKATAESMRGGLACRIQARGRADSLLQAMEPPSTPRDPSQQPTVRYQQQDGSRRRGAVALVGLLARQDGLSWRQRSRAASTGGLTGEQSAWPVWPTWSRGFQMPSISNTQVS